MTVADILEYSSSQLVDVTGFITSKKAPIERDNNGTKMKLLELTLCDAAGNEVSLNLWQQDDKPADATHQIIEQITDNMVVYVYGAWLVVKGKGKTIFQRAPVQELSKQVGTCRKRKSFKARTYKLLHKK